MTSLDPIDLQILDLLQRDAHMTNAQVAEAVGLTAPSVFERVRKLEQRGVIRGYTIRVDPAALDKTVTAFVRLTVAYDEKQPRVAQVLRDDPDVLECYTVAGEDCYILKTRVDSPAALEALLNRIRGQMTVQRSVTMIVLSAIKEGGPLSASRPAAELAAAAEQPNGAGHAVRTPRSRRKRA